MPETFTCDDLKAATLITDLAAAWKSSEAYMQIGDAVNISLATGKVTLSERITLDDASREFWAAVERLAPMNVQHLRDVERANRVANDMLAQMEARAIAAEQKAASLEEMLARIPGAIAEVLDGLRPVGSGLAAVDMSAVGITCEDLED